MQKVKLPYPTISKLDERGKPRVIIYNAQGKPAYSKEVVVLAYPSGDAHAYRDTAKIINVSSFLIAKRMN